MFPAEQMPQGTTNSATSTQTNSQDKDEEQVAVDLDQRVEVADSTKDYNIVPPPPKAGDYIIQWELAEKDGLDYRASKKVGTFLQCHFVGRLVVDGDYKDFVVNDYMNSVYSQLKGTTPLHDFLHKLGHTIPQSLNIKELRAFVESAMASKPMGTANLEWRVSYKDMGNQRANKDGYVTMFNKMIQFPRNQDGSYKHEVGSPIDGTPLYAQVYVNQHLKK